MPIDLLLTISENKVDGISYEQYVEDWRKGMKEAYQIAQAKSSKRKEADRKRWNAKPLLSTLQVGDRVLVQNKKRKKGPSKLVSHWEPAVYKVMKVVDENNVVYEIKREDGKGRRRVLHRNMLLPVGDEFDLGDAVCEPAQSQVRENKVNPSKCLKVSSSDEDSMSSDEEDDVAPKFFPSRFISQRNKQTNSEGQGVQGVQSSYAEYVHPQSESEHYEDQLSVDEHIIEGAEQRDKDSMCNAEVFEEDGIPLLEHDSDCETDEDITEECESDRESEINGEEIAEEYMLSLSESSEEGSMDEHDDDETEEDAMNVNALCGDSQSDKGVCDKAQAIHKSTRKSRLILEAQDPNTTPLTKARRRRMDERCNEWKRKRDALKRAKRTNFDILSQESPVKAAPNNDIQATLNHTTNDSPESIDIAEGSEQVVSGGQDVTVTEGEQESTTSSGNDSEIQGVSINDDLFFNTESEDPVRRGTRNRRQPTKLSYDVRGKPNVSEVVCDSDELLIEEIQCQIDYLHAMLQTLRKPKRYEMKSTHF